MTEALIETTTVQLVPVFTADIGGKTVHACDARALHSFLESKQQFADWIKERIEKYGFMQDVDFTVIHNFMKDDTAFGSKPTNASHPSADKSTVAVVTSQKTT